MRDYFCGWYLKCQSDTQTLAVIPAIHISKKMKSSSIQLITDEEAWNIELTYHDFHKQKQPFHIKAAANYFGQNGIKQCLNTSDCWSYVKI